MADFLEMRNALLRALLLDPSSQISDEPEQDEALLSEDELTIDNLLSSESI
jgi:hypothetical protein